MSKNIENIAKKFEEACTKTDILNESIGNMTQVLTTYNKTLGNVNRNNKLKEIVEFGKNIEERIENVEIYNSKLVMDSLSEINTKSEERLKKFIKTQITNSKDKQQQVSFDLPDDFSNKISMLLENQEFMIDTIKSMKNDRTVRELEIKLNNANIKISKMKEEQMRKEKYFESKMMEFESKLFFLNSMISSDYGENLDDVLVDTSDLGRGRK